MWSIEWDAQNRESAGDVKEVEQLLQRIRLTDAESPVLVSIEDANGNSLAIGVGGERSVANFIGSTKEPPYYTSVGELGGDDEILSFMFMGSLSEFPLCNSIDNELALDAVREFCITGARPSCLVWEED